jgi:hypothetical protein
VSVAIDRNPIVAIPVLIRSVAITHMMPVMNVFVKRLGNPKSHGQHDTVQPIEYPRDKIGVMNMVVRDSVDVPGNAHGVD